MGNKKKKKLSLLNKNVAFWRGEIADMIKILYSTFDNSNCTIHLAFLKTYFLLTV